MEGFVYVMSNRAMPGLVKVGYTHNTPSERAAQLNGTHSPHAVEVEYAIEVPDPRAVEREAHLRLRAHREGKEWFRCSREVAIAAVKRSAGEVAKNEFSRIDEEKRRDAAMAEIRATAEAQRKAQADEDRKAALRREVEARHRQTIEQLGNAPGYLPVWAGTSVVACIGLATGTHLSAVGIVLGGVLAAGIPAVIIKEWAAGRQRRTKPFLEAMARRQAELDAIDRPTPRPAAWATPKAVSPTRSLATSPSMPKPATPPAPSWVSAASAPKVATPLGLRAPAQPSITSGYTVELPTMPIALDKSPEQRARERSAQAPQDPST